MKQRNGTVDFLKFIFAVLIVMFHSKNLATGVEESYFIGGSIGVDFFFLVSGFFLASSALKKPYLNEKSLGEDTFEFMKHKIAGLMPNYYVAWTIAFAVFHIVQTSTLKIIIKGEYPKDCVNLQTDVRYNYSVWRFLKWQEKRIRHKKQ